MLCTHRPVLKTLRLSVSSADEAYVQSQQPHKMLVTQRIFWVPNGLLRVLNIALSLPEGQEKEWKVRQLRIVSHQITGYVTLASFVMHGITRNIN